MIHYNQEQNVFHLFNKDISYLIHVNGFGRLETLYFGEKLNDVSDILNARTLYTECTYLDKKMSLVTPTPSYFYPDTLVEISSHGIFDKRDAPIVIQHENGSYLTDFEYVKHRIYHGIKPLDGMPCLDAPLERKESLYNKENVDTLEIILKDITANVILHEYLSVYRDKNIIVKSFKIENKGKRIKLLRAFSMQLDLPSSDYYFHHFHGTQWVERQEEINKIYDGTQEIGSTRGRSSHQENPFCFLSKERNSLTDGEVIGFNLIYSGNWEMRVTKTPYDSLHLAYGINDDDFCFSLGRNESFDTPQAVISYSKDGIDGMSQTFHRLIKENLQTDKEREHNRPLIFNSWEGCLFTFDTKVIKSYIDDACKLGIELFVLDDGWFGKRDNDKSGLGDWFVNEKKINLHEVIEHCHERKLKFGIWFEPEMVNPDSDLFRSHPEWALGYEENKDWSHLERNQLVLDFTNDDVVDNIFEQMCKILDEYDIDYVKWDHNRILAEHFTANLPAEKQGEAYHRYVLGYYRLLSQLRIRYPEIFFEGCSSGGGRFDLGTLYYVPQIWTSDETDGASRAYIQYYTSLGYPLSTISSHVSASAQTTYPTKVDIALFGTYGYEMNPNKLSEREFAEMNRGTEIYHKYHDKAILNGTLYHLSNPLDHDEMSMISVSQDQTLAIAVYYEKSNIVMRMDYWKLKGLNPKKRYHLNLNGVDVPETYSGEHLMKVGYYLRDIFRRQNKTILLILKESNY